MGSMVFALIGCGSSDEPSTTPPPPEPPPPPPAPTTVSVAFSTNADIAEELNTLVRVNVNLSAATTNDVTVELTLAGTATLDADYSIDHSTLTIPAGENSSTAIIDIFRDFEEESNETIEVSLGTISGGAEAGEMSSDSLTIIDGPPSVIDKIGFEIGLEEGFDAPVPLFPLQFTVIESGVVLRLQVANTVQDESAELIAELSTEWQFGTDVRELDRFEIPAPMEGEFVFADVYKFEIDFNDLEPQTNYFIRAYINTPPAQMEFSDFALDYFFNGFSTNEHGAITVSCQVGERQPQNSDDPLFEHQWHLDNTGQTAFAEEAGTSGADLNMGNAINRDLGGEGTIIGIVDSGLQVCHPDLTDNVLEGGSYNFAYGRVEGAKKDDPFYFSVLGDHGTSVAGIAAASANNGFGGRGVASSASIVGFNPLEIVGENPFDEFEIEGELKTAFLRSLGGSESDPNSSQVDVFNMSFGSYSGTDPIDEEILRLHQMGTRELRDGLGAVYVKAAGNSFDICYRSHPLQQEIGCLGSNSDSDQNVPYLINVGGFNANDRKSSYSSAGANLWVVGPSGEDGWIRPAMITTDQVGRHAGYSEFPENLLSSDNPLNLDGDYVSAFGGTSSAAPAVAGAISILLAEKPALTWRDVKHILASTARKLHPGIERVRVAFNGKPFVSQPAWTTNAAGFEFHNWYGFGAVDIDGAIEMAQTYSPNSLGDQIETDWFDSGLSEDSFLSIPDLDGEGVNTQIEVSGLPETANIEAVILSISVDHTDAFDLAVAITSPAGTRNVVNAPYNSILVGEPGFYEWNLLDNSSYGENPNGSWTVNVVDLASEDSGSVTGAKLRIYHGDHPNN